MDTPRRTRRGSHRSSSGKSSHSNRAEKPRVSRVFYKRNATLFFAMCVVFCLIALRLFWLAVVQGPSLAAKAEATRNNTEVVLAKRGTIYDRNGEVLATSVECSTLTANPRTIQKANDVDEVSQMLADNLGGTADEYKENLNKDTTFVYVEKNVDKDTASQTLKALEAAKLTGVYTEPSMKRIYPWGDVAVQVLGFVNNDGEGVTGLELQYNDVLAGTNGEITREEGADGTPIAGGAYSEKHAVNGTDIVTSLDINIQQTAEEKIVEAQKTYSATGGMVTVTEPKTGEILAMCSTPLYRASAPSNEALVLKNVSQSFEPGSIMKILTACIGEDAGLFDNDTVRTVPEGLAIGEHTIHDAEERHGTESMSTREILRVSSNIGAALMGRDIGSTAFAHGIRSFGIGSKTGIDFPGETEGLLPSENAMTQTDLSYMSFGQSLSVPQIQMVKAFDAVANGGILTTPHFVVWEGTKKLDWPEQGQACSAETTARVTDMMRTVVTSGTATAAQIQGYDIAAKTGTGEQASTHGYVSSSYLSTLIGFAPASDPQILVSASLTGVSYLAGSSVANTWQQIMAEALQDLGIGPTE